MSHGPKFLAKRAQWEAWHVANPEFWVEFDARSKFSQDHHKRRLSAWCIVNFMRWERALPTAEDAFAVGNDFIAFFARKWMAADPLARGRFFKLKQMIDEDLRLTKKECGVL